MMTRLDEIRALLAEVKRGGVFPSCERADTAMRLLVAEVERTQDAVAAERIEVAHLREAFVTMEKAANEREHERDALQRKLTTVLANYNEEAGRLMAERDGHRGDAAKLRADLAAAGFIRTLQSTSGRTCPAVPLRSSGRELSALPALLDEVEAARAEATDLQEAIDINVGTMKLLRDRADKAEADLDKLAADYTDLGELLFGEAEYEHGDVRGRVVSLLDELEAARAELDLLHTQIDYIKTMQDHKDMNPGDELIALRQSEKHAWDEAAQARIDGAENLMLLTQELQVELAAARAVLETAEYIIVAHRGPVRMIDATAWQAWQERRK